MRSTASSRRCVSVLEFACRRDCDLEALRLDPTHVLTWGNLGADLAASERVVVGDREMTKRDCYLEALRLDPRDALTWCNLGVDLAAGERVVVGGREMAKRDCALEALRLGSSEAGSWFALGDPGPWPWFALGQSLGPNETAIVGARIVRAVDFFIEALSLKPSFRWLWSSLADSMSDDETVAVNGVTYDKAGCEAKALECNAGTANNDALFALVSTGYGEPHPFAAAPAIDTRQQAVALSQLW